MSGLELAKADRRSAKFEKLKTSSPPAERLSKTHKTVTDRAAAVESPRRGRHDVPVLAELPTPPDFRRHVMRNTPIEQIWSFVNPLMLYGRHLGIRGNTVRQLDDAASEPAHHPRDRSARTKEHRHLETPSRN